jgi:hypothetical protein
MFAPAGHCERQVMFVKLCTERGRLCLLQLCTERGRLCLLQLWVLELS